MSIEKWLRKYDVKTQKWTNQCFAFNVELAKEPNYREVDANEAAQCALALAAEKKANCLKRQLANATENTVKPALNKIADKPAEIADVEKPLTLAEIEAETAVADIPADVETVTASAPALVVAETPRVDDGLDAMDKPALIAIVEAEGLTIKKTYNAENLRPLIRMARKNKIETPKES